MDLEDSDDEDEIFPADPLGGVQGHYGPPPTNWSPNMQPPMPFNASSMPQPPDPQQMPTDAFAGSYKGRPPVPQGPPMAQGPAGWQQQQSSKDGWCGLDPRSWPQQGNWNAPHEGEQRLPNAARSSQPSKGGWPQMQKGPPQMPPNMQPNMPPQMQMQGHMPMPMQGAVFDFFPVFMEGQGPMPPPMRPEGDSGCLGGKGTNNFKGEVELAAAHLQAQLQAQMLAQALKGKGGGGSEGAYPPPEWPSQDSGKAFPQSHQKGGKGGCGQENAYQSDWRQQDRGKQGWMPMPPEMQQHLYNVDPMGQAPMGWQQQAQQPQPSVAEQMRKGQEKGSRNRHQMQSGPDDWRRNAYDKSWQKGQGYQANQQQNHDGWQRSQPSKRNGGKKGQHWNYGEDAYSPQKGWQQGDKGGFDRGSFHGKTGISQEASRQMAADIAAQPKGKNQDSGLGKRGGGLANTLRQVGKPSIPTKAQQMRAAQAQNFHGAPPEEPPEHGTSLGSSCPPPGPSEDESRGGKGRGGGKNAPAPGRSLRVSWVLPGDASGSRETVVSNQDDGDEENRVAKELEGMDLSDVKAVLMRLENSVAGCQVTVNLNGENSVLNSGGFGKKGLVSQEKRFKISPLSKVAESDETDCAAEDQEDEPPQCQAAVEEAPVEATDSSSEAPVEISSREVACESVPAASEPTSATERRRPTASVAPAAFAATVTLDTSEVQAKTTQELIDPDVDVVDIFDTAAVLRMTDLTGDRFELTVYASGSSDNAATLVHRGPIRSPESVHRIGQLEPSQVYVAWVRVFCEDKVRESKQKGFKTLAARVKTIWDQPDHEILGVSKDATAKEITKAFRQKSLQCHPDKETDPEKKDAAEEHMKRLNLAKQNMMRCAPKDSAINEPDIPAPESEASPAPPADGQDPSPTDPFFGGSPEGFDSGDDTGSDMDTFWRPRPGTSPKARHPSEAQEPEEPAREEGNLCCSLRIEAAKPPSIKVIERGLTSLSINASGLPLAGTVEVQKFQDGIWQAALPAVKVTSDTMGFTLTDLQENSSYRLRLRTTIELEPLRLAFAQFSEDGDDVEAPTLKPAADANAEQQDEGEEASSEGEAHDSAVDESEHEQDVLESEEELDQEGQAAEDKNAFEGEEEEEDSEDVCEESL